MINYPSHMTFHSKRQLKKKLLTVSKIKEKKTYTSVSKAVKILNQNLTDYVQICDRDYWIPEDVGTVPKKKDTV